jgi:putative nucleotidyltransferase with HDIG domain
MDLGIDRQKAQQVLEGNIKDPITRLHMIESEAIMKAVARKLGEDEEKWGIIGLLHDIDWELTKNNPVEHGLKMPEILKNAGGTDFLIKTIESHIYPNDNEETFLGNPKFVGKKREGNLEHVLAASETLTGLIIATALIMPDKKLASVKLESLIKKFKNKSFAAKCNRETIAECEKLGVPLEEFLGIGLRALQEISDQIGL